MPLNPTRQVNFNVRYELGTTGPAREYTVYSAQIRENNFVQLFGEDSPTQNDFMLYQAKGQGFSLHVYIPSMQRHELCQQSGSSMENIINERLHMLVGLHQLAIQRFNSFGGVVEPNHCFEIVFGRTILANRMPFHYENIVFPNYSKFKDIGDPRIQEIICHEIGHSLAKQTWGKALTNPNYISLEEGFCDHIAGLTENLPLSATPPTSSHQMYVSLEQAANINGLTQLDVELSLVGKIPQGNAGPMYLGYTTHRFGKEFITAFIELFPKTLLIPLFKSLSGQPLTNSDRGTEYLRSKLNELLADDPKREEKIAAFEKRLHQRLLDEGRVFSTIRGMDFH